VLLAIGVAASLAGCSPYWAASGDLFVEYRGPDRAKAEACARHSTSPEHRTSTNPLYWVATDIEVTSPTASVWDVSGTTKIAGEDTEYLTWSCQVSIDVNSRTMHTELLEIAPGAEVAVCGRKCSSPSEDEIEVEEPDAIAPEETTDQCIDLAAAVAASLDESAPQRASGRQDHGSPIQYHGTLETTGTTYEWTCRVNRVWDPWMLDYELTSLDPH
jgi:hypothetical protein